MKNATEIAQAFRLKRKGREFRGDCPICQARKLELAVWDDAGKVRCKCFYGACDSRELFRILMGIGPVPPTRYREKAQQGKVMDLAGLWTDSLPPHGSPVSKYLQFRGFKGEIPECIRYLPSHKHTPSGQTYPVMLARVNRPTGELQALHRTYLQPDGQGKTGIEPAKMTLGPVGGAAIRLARATDQVILCEGIETGLALLQETGLPVWACVSAGGLKTVILPESIRSVIVAADHDCPGMAAAEAAAIRLYYEGRAVKVIKPEQPGTDFADQIFKLEK